ncbi:MAG: class I SAM-dependent methyltransferase [Dehalogenimonas sp.]|uniref:Class I SAM-dependent methyltransferase n=1 Tax=Candidatus Dehalogenimonas loeffleri TaxID=3127115 RepID=A0ABZ2JB15_9CHLR|nr:class I SAM-dependent methyltransferase [Dehalogenimonas sp.]
MLDHKKAEFDAIAPGWYNFRHYTIFGSELTALADRWIEGKLLNAGCGHGADFLPFRGRFELSGIDLSSEMLKYAAKYAAKHQFDVKLDLADMRSLPFPDSHFDQVIAVASLHHIKTRSEQLLALQEIKRVLRPEGELFLTVWNAGQPKFWFTRRDTFIPWRTGGRSVNRFYHLFTYGEIKKLARRAGFEIISISPEANHKGLFKYFSRNICLLLRKPAS